MRRALAGAGLAAVVSLVPGPAASEFAAPETTEVRLGTDDVESSDNATFLLAHRFLLVGSERVVRGGRALRPDVDYRLDPDPGTVRLAEPLAPGETLEVSYAWVPVELPRDWLALVRGEPTPAESTRIGRARTSADGSVVDRLSRVVDEDLVIGGAKTLSLAVGSNKDAEVEQSLRVSVTGRIGEDVRLTALLSDQNIPLQPEGNTQRLEELDEVLIRLDAPRGSATLGDFVAKREASAFGDFERRLSGAEAVVRAGGSEARGIGASTRGNFRTVEFRGEEGKQGPYVIAGSGVNLSGVIVAGSERVWMDGVRLQRGEADDYVIDYARGEVEFTNRRLVTEDSEIAIDFEEAEQDYRRSFYLGEAALATGGGKLSARASVASEADGDDPRSVSLTDEARESLSDAGDGTILVSGVNCGVENGDYVQIGDRFEYAGRDSGTCDVSFTFVGPGQGDYVRDRDLDAGLTFWRHVPEIGGVKQGDWTPGLELTAPRTASLADVALGWKAGGWNLAADGAFSREDRNTLSSRDDDDNEGAAGKVALGWERKGREVPGGPLRLRAGATWRGEEAEFRSLGRTRDAFLGEVWNFTDTLRTDESVGEVNGRISAGETWQLGGTVGVLDRPGRFRSARRAGDVAWRDDRGTNAAYRIESVRRESDSDSAGTVVGDLRRERANVGTSVAWLRPGVSYWKEGREESGAATGPSGRDQVEVGGSLGFTPGSFLSGEIRAARRTTDIVEEGDWRRESVGRTWEVRADARTARTVRARFSWIRRDLEFVPGRDGVDRTTNLTRSDLSHENFDGRVRGEWVYETTSRFFTDRLAPPGTTIEEPTLAVKASARVRVGAGNRGTGKKAAPAGPLDRLLARVRSETVIRIEEETTTDDRTGIYLLDLSRYRDDDETVFGRIQLREEITVFPGGGPFTLTARWERTDTADNRADPERIDILASRTVLRATNRFGPRWSIESQGTREDDSRSDSGSGTTEFDIRRLEWSEELAWQPRPANRIAGRAAWIDERNEAEDASIRGISLGLATSTSIRRRGRWTSDVSWTHPLEVEGVDRVDRFRTRDTDQLDWRTGVDLKLSDSINASITYSGRSREGTPTTHLARAEARALF